ncbi:hypothetical protein AB0903_10645 [Streptomyces sp. NPDC048389]|uniref:hypothetical protein n=1 Tax=Streptomyces sp. NPDC048389 TaxID=3154622 RepID=UPI003457129E
MSAVPPAEEEPSHAAPPARDAAGTDGWAKASPHARAAWTTGGAVLIVVAVVLFFVLHERIVHLGTGPRYALGLTLRGALSLTLLAGTYCVVRGRWRG